MSSVQQKAELKSPLRTTWQEWREGTYYGKAQWQQICTECLHFIQLIILYETCTVYSTCWCVRALLRAHSSISDYH